VGQSIHRCRHTRVPIARQLVGMAATSAGLAQARYVSGASEVQLTSTVNINDSAFHHVALVFDVGTNATFYVDGNRVSTSTVKPTFQPQVAGLLIAGLGTAATFDRPGAVDEIRISNTARCSGASYAVPPAAFVADVATVALYHLQSGVSNAAVPANTPNIFPDDSPFCVRRITGRSHLAAPRRSTPGRTSAPSSSGHPRPSSYCSTWLEC
jgi:hypothetical protein